MLTRSVIKTCFTASKQHTQVSLKYGQPLAIHRQSWLLIHPLQKDLRFYYKKNLTNKIQITRNISLLARAVSSKKITNSAETKSPKSAFTFNWITKKSPVQLYFGSFIQKHNYTTASSEFEF